MQSITCELKYCERCGALKVRRLQSYETYCEGCEQVLTSFAVPGEGAPRFLFRRRKSDIVVAMPPVSLPAAAGRLQ